MSDAPATFAARRALPLTECYRRCRQIVRQSGSNFAMAFWLLPRPKREAMHALYAFARQVDDIGDGEGSPDEKAHALEEQWSTGLVAPHNHVLLAINDACDRYFIPRSLLEDVIKGVERDLTQTRYETWAELQGYCYQVAGAVGLACLYIWGFRGEVPEALARTCGEAFQLTNILRDVPEDAERGRCYLPLEDLRRFDFTFEDICDRRHLERFDALMAFELERAEQLYSEAAALHDLLLPDGQRVFRLMFGRYRAILAKIRRAPRAVLERRVALSLPQKLWIAARQLAASKL
jgi:phytoene synthase